MRILAFLLALLLCGVAQAQPLGGFVQGPAAAAPSGGAPCDQGITCTDGWGAQLLRAAYAGKALNACLVASTTTCADIGFDAGGGLLASDLTALGCTNDSTCLAKLLYSQFGGCDLTTVASANWPAIQVTTKRNGHVSLGWNGSAASELQCTETNNIIDFTIFAALQGTGVTQVSVAAIGADAGCGNGSGLNSNNANPPLIQADTFNGSCTYSNSNGVSPPSSTVQFIAYVNVFTSSVQAFVNGSSDTANTTVTPFATQKRVTVGSKNTSTAGWQGDINSVIIVSPHTASGSTICHALAVFWSTSPPC